MSVPRVVMVIDMQNGVFATPRFDREGRVARINQLMAQARQVIIVQHAEAGGLEEGSTGFAVLPDLNVPENALRVTKTACDAFYRTPLEALLREHGITEFVVCGCASDYCVDTTIKQAASRGFRLTIASDAHTTADRTAAAAPILITHYNEVWANLTVPDNAPGVLPTADILSAWQAN
ncbi:Isochorismatase [Cronobacter condimenti 1330]|uniref:Isochorismatase n=1 Tax=Cronobacter condimenti 1330 TaxID=1073999 RepID=K8A366_9ENTR|nr:isochorismatase family protein [Cronobacter condimenti]ALB61857.1 isochorismatase [Cronobacter condimenti 1330]CCJ74358.1 Isochorismatase [Cronobacter condimenti 1330]